MAHNTAQPTFENANRVTNIAIVGASGNIGSHIVSALLAKQRFRITAISRNESQASFPDEIAVAKVNYDNHESLTEAFKNQDALIITLSVFVASDTQTKLIRAAADAGVPWILPNEFGMYNTEAAQNETIGPGKSDVRKLIESTGVSSWIGITCGYWYEFSLSAPGYYGFDLARKKAVFFDDATQKINTSTWPQVARAVAALLDLPVSETDSSSTAVTLETYRNRMVYVSSFALNQREMFDALKQATGTSDSDWDISTEPAVERFENAVVQMKAGNRDGFVTALYTRYFFPGEDAGLFEKSHGLENERLGLPVEDLNKATEDAVKLWKSGYWET
jgi:predicted CoA-binding protein